ncbi:MAG: MoaD/ThiS family protein [Deltaproteobacteria bacterium]|nr:MoaD/ThiS family protein [Deltaproteobacteria bacterium]
MIVEIKIFSTLKGYVAESDMLVGDNRWEIPEGITACELGKKLKIPEKEIKIILINGRKADADHVLNEGDSVYIFPLLMGG